MIFCFSVLRRIARHNLPSVPPIFAPIVAASILLGGLALAPGALAQQDRYLDVHGGEFKPIPIAVTAFAGDAGAGTQLTGIITNNFKRSVVLMPLDPKTFAETIGNPDLARISLPFSTLVPSRRTTSGTER